MSAGRWPAVMRLVRAAAVSGDVPGHGQSPPMGGNASSCYHRAARLCASSARRACSAATSRRRRVRLVWPQVAPEVAGLFRALGHPWTAAQLAQLPNARTTRGRHNASFHPPC